MKKEVFKIKLGIVLRSASMALASSLIYLVVRSIIEHALYDNIKTNEFLKDWQYRRMIVKFFIGFSSLITIATLLYNWIFPSKKEIDLKIVISVVLLFVLLFELFIF